MARPRVFVSSTCYDLASERDSLIDFCHSFGFDVVLSERGDVFFHPDLHTHEACVSEISSCHILVLIVGGRFGGKYVTDSKKSITNAEYSAAKNGDLPVFSFIKQDVLQDHNVWQRNKQKPFAKEIIYPSIDKQEHAQDIFNFIDEVRLSKNNNAYFPFNLPREIHEHLRKQWASLFLEALNHRNLSKKISGTQDSIAKLSSVAQRIEDLTKSMFQSFNPAEAKTSIQKAESESEARKMFNLVARIIDDNEFLSSTSIDECINPPPDNWWEFLIEGSYFEQFITENKKGTAFRALMYLDNPLNCIAIDRGLGKQEDTNIETLERSYNAFKNLPRDLMIEIFDEFSHTVQANLIPFEDIENNEDPFINKD